MTDKYIQDGEVINYANAGSAIASGDVVVVGRRLGVALVDIAATTGTGAVQMTGVFRLPAVNGAAFVQGDQVIWDASLVAFDDAAHTPQASGDVVLGATAWITKTAGATDTIDVALSGLIGTVTP